MKKNGVEVIQFAKVMMVGYPPCSYINNFKGFIKTKFDLKVIVGTHPIPEKYLIKQTELKPGTHRNGRN
jgi:predicted metal-binding protein